MGRNVFLGLLGIAVLGCYCGSTVSAFLGEPCSTSNPSGALATSMGQCSLYSPTCDTTQPQGACTLSCDTAGDNSQCSEAEFNVGVCARVHGSLQCARRCELDGGCSMATHTTPLEQGALLTCPDDSGCPVDCCRQGYHCEAVPLSDGGFSMFAGCLPD
jgi:hypothetical protein